jgi:hypothetical protein
MIGKSREMASGLRKSYFPFHTTARVLGLERKMTMVVPADFTTDCPDFY